MDHARSSDIENLPGPSRENDDKQENVECIVDKMEFKTVWEQPEVNMQLVNQFMNQLNISNDNEIEDQSFDSNIMNIVSNY
jgi:hypothetical protein